MRKSIRHPLTIIIVAALLLQLISAVQFYYTRSLLADELEKRAESELTTKAVIAKSTLNMAENSLDGHLWDMMRDITYPDSMFGAAERVIRTHPNLLGCGIAFKPGFYPNTDRLFEPYVYRVNGRYVKQQVGGPGHDYTKSHFYQLALERSAPIWSDPYLDTISNQRIVTFCRPIFNEHRETVAVFFLDISTEWMGDTLNYRHIYPSSYDFVLSERGQFIAGPRRNKVKWHEVENIIRMINDSTVAKTQSASGRSWVFSIRDPDGDNGTVFFADFKGIPKWKMAVVCYDKEVYAKLHHMRRNIGILMLLGLLILGLIIFRFAKNARNLHKVKLEQERIGSELRIARGIQMQMLPKASMPYTDRPDIDIFGSLYPAKEVGGDLYDFFLRDEKLFFCIGDVSGKGVPSAMVMAVIHSLFRSVSVHENNPSRMMQHLNEMACEGNESNMFVTLLIGVLDLPTGRLRYCNAGHDKPLLVGDTVMELPAKPHLPIGLFADTRYETQRYLVPSMTTIFLYTDGLTEAKNRLHKMFGLTRVQKILDSNRALEPKALLEQMKAEVHQFVEDAEQSDDLTMLAIRYVPKQEDTMFSETLTLKNDPSQISLLSSFVKDVLGRMDLAPKLAKEIRLAIEEAVVNVIDYAYPVGTEGDITLCISNDGSQVKVVVSDGGSPFDPTGKDQADTSLSVEDRPIGGLGIHLIRQLMDSINYERQDGRNVLTLWKKIPT